MHPDLWGQQLLMDKEYNVLSVIDWDETSMAPWLEFCAYPANLKLAMHRIEMSNTTRPFLRVSSIGKNTIVKSFAELNFGIGRRD
jgi:hypothetical protein